MNDTNITITGNIGTPPEQKVTSAGVPLTKFRLASTERRLDRSTGQWVDGPTSWYAVSMFRDLAQHAFESLAKGDRVILTGRLRIRNWDNGVKQGTDAEIEADAIGHDLRWGTSRFERTHRSGTPTPQPSTDEWATEPRRVGDLGDEGAGTDDDSVAWAVPNSPAELEELVPASGETPF